MIRVEMPSPSVPLTVRPLPTSGRPANFKEIVGDFNINAQADRNQTPRTTW